MSPKGKKPTRKPKSETKPMPSLIINEGVLPEKEKNELMDHVEKSIARQPVAPEELDGYNPSARRWMWAGVITVTIAILGLWAFSISSQFSSLRWGQEKNLVAETRDNWQKAFDGHAASTEQLKSEVKQKLNTLISGFAAAASSSVSSSDIVASTTTTVSTTKF